MLLERKFSRLQASSSSPNSPRCGAARGPIADPPLCPALPDADWSQLPEVLYDVICNLQLLIGARRKYSHVFSDFGLSASNGQHGLEAQTEVLQVEVPEVLARYERRFRMDELEVDVDDAGEAGIQVTGELLPAPGKLVFRFGIISRRLCSFEYTPAPAG